MVSRRDFVRIIGIGGAAALAAACGPAVAPPAAPTTAPAAAPKAAETAETRCTRGDAGRAP